MIQNIVIGQPRYPPGKLLATDDKDWETNEKSKTLFINGKRFLPRLIVMVHMAPSIS